MTGRLAWEISKGTVSEFMEDGVPRLAAALAYYAMFSIGPLLVIVMAVAGLVFSKSAVTGEVSQQLQTFAGKQTAQTVQSMLATQTHDRSILATVLGTAALILGATGVFGQLQDALNTIWEVKPKPGQGVWGFIRTRFLSFTMVLGIAFLLLISMVITTALEAFSGVLDQALPMPGVAAKALHLGISFIVITLLFAMIFKVLPDATVKWRDVWVGAMGTSALFTVGKFLIATYLGQESTKSAYGAAGSVVVLLLWIYYSSLILFFGAEFTQVYAKKTGSSIAPSPKAIAVTEEARAQQGIPHNHVREQIAQPSRAQAGDLPDHETWRENGRSTRPLSVLSLGAGFVGGWIAHRKLTRRRSSG